MRVPVHQAPLEGTRAGRDTVITCDPEMVTYVEYCPYCFEICLRTESGMLKDADPDQIPTRGLDGLLVIETTPHRCAAVN